ncbi:MAG: hypothetical protein ER33_07830 [Cyanobium sp. CACIAM 14]|nr:MAG: hypothetical protein ER33_07830 [Cyanobium sp. CACIAM 14]
MCRLRTAWRRRWFGQKSVDGASCQCEVQALAIPELEGGHADDTACAIKDRPPGIARVNRRINLEDGTIISQPTDNATTDAEIQPLGRTNGKDIGTDIDCLWLDLKHFAADVAHFQQGKVWFCRVATTGCDHSCIVLAAVRPFQCRHLAALHHMGIGHEQGDAILMANDKGTA